MAIAPTRARITLYSASLLAAALVTATALPRFFAPPTHADPVRCTQISSNMRLVGPAFTVGQDSLPKVSELGWDKLDAHLQEGDTVQAYETSSTAGHVLLRGKCIVAQTLAWIR